MNQSMKTAFALILLTGLFSGCLNSENSTDTQTSVTIEVDSAFLAAALPDLPLDRIKLPDGFSISLFAAVPNARSLAKSPSGTIFVGNRRGENADKVYAIKDLNQDGIADELYIIDEGLRMPNGVAFYNGSLFVATVDSILRYDDIEANLKNPPEPVLVSNDLPSDAWHGWKFIAFGPDGKLYVPVGAPCNVCDSSIDDPEDDYAHGFKRTLYASITRMNPDGSDHEVFAKGVRNTVGFDWHPETGNLWFTDNGRDNMGDEIPNCELNHVTEAGQHFGFPFIHEGDIPDPDFGNGRNPDEFVKPAQKLGPHVAPLGMRFYNGSMFPDSYKNSMIIALHGSWNRTNKSGYQVMMANLDGDEVSAYEVFAEGWLNETLQEAWGRPVDVLELADGSILISDDFASVIYRVTYQQI